MPGSATGAWRSLGGMREAVGADWKGLARVKYQAAPAAISDPDPIVATTALNAAVERIARRDPAQYQWTYKRYKQRPPGSGQTNPYLDLERKR